MKIGIHKARYRHSQWYYYIIPKRLTLKSNPAIYKWLWFVIDLSKEDKLFLNSLNLIVLL